LSATPRPNPPHTPAQNPERNSAQNPAPGDACPLWALIPVKPFGEGKSRLAPTFGRTERAQLSRILLGRVLHAVAEAGCFAGAVVVSRDAEVLRMAAEAGALPLPELRRDLNAALEQGRAFAVVQGAGALLVLPADLPNVTAAALRTVAEQAAALGDGPGVAIAPSATGGTNALLLQPPAAIPFSYGLQSAARHAAFAHARALPVLHLEIAALTLDVDLPEDLPDDLPLAAAEAQPAPAPAAAQFASTPLPEAK
jgi:2-phospho-L-lactate guanylyltransferase